jgi:hypothetical protein
MSNNKPIRRSNKHEPALGGSMPSAGPCNGEVNSSASKRPLRPNWLNYTTTNPLLGLSGA